MMGWSVRGFALMTHFVKMNTNFKDIMSKRTDEELIRIVTVDKDSYQPLPIQAAEKEIENRGMDLTNIDKMKAFVKG
jgi:hypothetical protein